MIYFEFVVEVGGNSKNMEVEEDDMLTQQRKNFEADKAKGDAEMENRTTFFDYDFLRSKKQKSRNQKISLWRRILCCSLLHKQSSQAVLEVYFSCAKVSTASRTRLGWFSPIF